jgi:uncharacterized protein (TIGR00255 family)
MINSMTGYGEAQSDFNGVSYVVEIKTVNNRYFKAIVRLPEAMGFLEDDVDKLLRSKLARGTVNYVLRLKDASADALFDIDEAALKTMAGKLAKIQTASGINGTIDMGGLLSMPGIVRPIEPDEETARQIKENVLGITAEALQKLSEMRAAEGKALQADLSANCDEIEKAVELVRARSELVIHEYAKRLKKRVDELLAHAELKLDEELLSREVAIFADRSDISEELARLDSHLKQFTQSCKADEQVGRRLDFICQEMLREANTIASKACDMQITQHVVDIKCRIDRIKEQVQNVE